MSMIEIIRYKNRKYYNYETSKYMSSSELLELFKTKADFVIRDPEGNDITEECIVTAMVLANINNEEFRDHVLSYAN